MYLNNQKYPPIPTSQNTIQPGPPSCHQTNVTFEEVDDKDAVPVTPTCSHHVTFAGIPFSTPSSEDVLIKGQSTPLQPESSEYEYFNDVFQSPSSGSSLQSTPSPSPSQCSPTPSYHHHSPQHQESCMHLQTLQA